jgi:hypothetical protein
MYGGGFATIPAYLSDLFGTQMVGAIHGRLLTAWSTAGVLGPVIVNYIKLKQGVAKSAAYDTTLNILAALLVGGFICTVLVRRVAPRWFMTDAELDAERRLAREASATHLADGSATAIGHGRQTVRLAVLWSIAGVPLAWGVFVTLSEALILFR